MLGWYRELSEFRVQFASTFRMVRGGIPGVRGMGKPRTWEGEGLG